jgi:hypothetical protein
VTAAQKEQKVVDACMQIGNPLRPAGPASAGVFVMWCLNSDYNYLQERIRNKPIERGWENAE